MTEEGHNSSHRTACRQGIVAGLGFGFIMGLALLVRLYRIGDEGFHWDEALTLRAFFGLYPRGFADAFYASRAIDPPMTPVYFLLQYAWGGAVGVTPLSMHVLSVIFSVPTLVAVFFLGRRLGGVRTGLWAMFLLAASPIHVYYSMEIRNYSLTALLGALSLLSLLRGVQFPTRRAWIINFAIDLLLAMSHLFANLLFVPQALFLLLCHRRRNVLVPWGISHAVVSVVVASWVRTCDFTAMRSSLSGANIPPLSWEGAYNMFTALTGAAYAWVGPTMGNAGWAGGSVAFIFLLGLLLLSAEWCLLRKVTPGEAGNLGTFGVGHGVFLLVLTVIVPPVLLAVATAGGMHCLYPRYAICSAVATPIVMACALKGLRSAIAHFVLAAVLILMNVSSLGQMLHNRPQRSSWTPIIRFLTEEVKKEDYFVLFSSSPTGFSSMIEMLLPVTPAKVLRRENWTPRDFEELAAWHARGIQAWCVTGTEVERPIAEFEAMLGAYNLPFSRHLFKIGGYLIYCVPSFPVEFSATGASEIHAPLAAGSLRGGFTVEVGDRETAMGITRLASAEHPYAPIFMRPSLALQSVTDGHSGEEWRYWNGADDRLGDLRLPSNSCVEAHWPVNILSNQLECRMRHSFSGGHAVDMLFEVTPDEAGNGGTPLVFTWVSNVRAVCSPVLHFPGIRDGARGWVGFGESSGERGAVAFAELSGTKAWQERGGAAFNPVENVTFSEPVFYGLVDGDQNEATDGDVMAFILMFEHPEDTRFVLRDCKDNSQAVEWDWQYVVRAPEPGKTSSQRVRLVYKPFLGQEDVLAEYYAWRDASPSQEASTSDAQILPPLLSLLDGEEKFSLAALERIAELDPKKALDAYVKLLEVPLCRHAAADGIDGCFIRFGDDNGLAAQWEAIAARDKRDALAWGRVGTVRNRMGDFEGAAEAFAKGLETDAQDLECLTGLAEIRFGQGNIGAALRLAELAVVQNPAFARQTASSCTSAARARVAAGDAAGAEEACRAALRFVPRDIPPKMLLGQLLIGRGRTESGLAFLGEVVAADPNMTETVTEVCSAIADACIKEGNAAAAAAVLRSAIANASNNPNHRMALGRVLEASGDDQGALAEYEAAMVESPEASQNAQRVEALLEKRADPSARVDLWRRLASACPNAVLPRIHLGAALEAVGDTAGAELSFRTVLQRDAENGDAKLCLGRLLVCRGDSNAGLALINEAAIARPDMAWKAAEGCAIAARRRMEAGDGTGAVAALQCARLLAPQNVAFRADLAAALESTGNSVAALEEYRAVVDEVPESPKAAVRMDVILDANGSKAARVEEWRRLVSGHPASAIPQLHLGLALEVSGDPYGALAAIEKALQIDPALTESVAVDRCVDAGDASIAVMVLRRARHLVPTQCQYAAALGRVLETVQDVAGAEVAYSDALQCDPASLEARLRLGALLAMRGEAGQGFKLIDEAAFTAPDSAGAAAHVFADVSKRRLQSGDAPGAADALRHALSLKPTVLGYHADLAAALEAAGDPAAALAEYRTVVEAAPESPTSSARIDALLDGNGDKGARVDLWKHMVSAHPEAAVPQLHLGLALEVSGDTAGARVAFEKALEIRPALAEARSALGRLENASGNGKQ